MGEPLDEDAVNRVWNNGTVAHSLLLKSLHLQLLPARQSAQAQVSRALSLHVLLALAHCIVQCIDCIHEHDVEHMSDTFALQKLALNSK